MNFYGDLTDEQLRDAIAMYNGGAPMPFAAAQDVAAPGPTVPPAALMQPAPEVAPAAPAPTQPAPAPAQPRMGAPRAARPQDPYQAAMAETDRLAGVRADAARGEAEVRARAGEADRDTLGRQRADVEASFARQEARRQDYQASREQGMADYRKLVEQAANIAVKDRRTRGQKGMAALAVGMGHVADGLAAAGATYAGTSSNTNYAQQVEDAINVGVERDLQEQRDARDNLRDRASAKLTELGLAHEYFQDENQADEWARQSIREQYGIELQQNAATLQSEVARQQGIAIGAQIEQDAANRKFDLWQAREEMRFKRSQAASRGQGQGVDWGKLTRQQLEQLSAQGVLPADGQVVLDRLRGPEQQAAQNRELRDMQGEKDMRARLDRVGDGVQRITAARAAVRDLLPYEAGAKDMPTTATGITGWLTPDRFVSTEGRQFKGQLYAAQDAFMRIATGAGATENEAIRQWKQFGLREDLNQSEESIRAGLSALAQRVSEYEAVLRAKDPEGYDLFEQNRMDELGGRGGGASQPQPGGDNSPMSRLKTSFGFRPKGGG